MFLNLSYMMKRICILFVLFAVFCGSKAQIAKWLIPPRYKYLQLVPNTTIYKGSVNDSTFLWNQKGEVLLATKHYVGPFVDGVAIVADGEELKGIINTSGKYVPINNNLGKLEIDSKKPVFSCGYLLVKNNEQYYYVNKDGNIVYGPFKEAFPFYQKITSVIAYENQEKLKGEYHALLQVDGSYIDFEINGKIIDKDNVTFCSVPNEQGKSIVVVKKDVYMYDNNSHSMTRLSVDGTQNKKSYVSLMNNVFMKNKLSEDNFVAQLNRGQLFFDANNVLTRMEIEGMQPVVYPKSHTDIKELDCFLATNISDDGESYGIDWIANGSKRQILPPQFSVVTDIIASNAVVCSNNNYGVVTLDPNSTFDFTLNDGNDIGFAHAKYPTNIQVALPKYISWQNVIMGTARKDMCEIIPVSRVGSDTKEGNFLKYDCNLFVPNDLTENRTDMDYYFYLDYDGLRSPIYPVSIKGWYVQQYDINLEKSWVETDTAYVELIANRKIEGTEQNYWFTVGCSSDDLPFSTETEKMDENRYVIKLYDMPDGEGKVYFEIKEDKCPPIRFPYNITYMNKTAKSKGRIIVSKLSK